LASLAEYSNWILDGLICLSIRYSIVMSKNVEEINYVEGLQLFINSCECVFELHILWEGFLYDMVDNHF